MIHILALMLVQSADPTAAPLGVTFIGPMTAGGRVVTVTTTGTGHDDHRIVIRQDPASQDAGRSNKSQSGQLTIQSSGGRATEISVAPSTTGSGQIGLTRNDD